MKLKKLKEIEANIDACIEAYDEALKSKDYQIAISAIEVMKYELNKLEENEIKLRTLPN